MLGKAPEGIITDQCKAMQNAIEVVFPTTRHRWCLWHIMKKIPEKLSRYGEYKRIKSAMKAVVYDTMTSTDFKDKWSCFIEKFELRQNDWLSRLYNERHRWAPTMLKKYFWAGMSTTQRSESIHAFFDGYINSTTSLSQFVKQYDNALKSRAEKEFQADFQCMDTTIPCGSTSSIEKQFQCEYTHAKFKEVQAEFRSKMNCVSSLKAVDGCVATYHVLEEVLVGDRPKECVYMVVFNRENHDVYCQCSLFEFRGILCRHVLCVCAQERLKCVPEKYVLARWKKNIKRKHSYIKSSYCVTELKPQMDRFDKLCKHFYEVAEVAAESEVVTNALHERLHEFSSNVPTMDATTQDVNKSPIAESNPDNATGIRSPLRVKRKGRPPTNRKMGVVEKVVRRARKRSKHTEDKETTNEANTGLLGNQSRSNVRVESSVEVVTGGDFLDTSTVSFGGNISFMDLLTTSDGHFMGSSQFTTNLDD